MNKCIVICLIGLLASGYTQALNSEILQRQKQEVINATEELRIQYDVPGMAISTFTSQGPQLSFALGHSNKERTKNFSVSETLVPVASVSKMFTSMGIFSLIQKGLITERTKLSDLNKTLFHRVVQNQCPEMMVQLEKIEISQLLSHTSGVTQDLANGVQWWTPESIEDGKEVTTEQFVKNFCKTQFVFEPGQIPAESKYSNLGFNLLGQIIEAYGNVTSYENYIQKSVFEPLQMTNSDFNLNKDQVDKMTVSWGNHGSVDPDDDQSRLALPKVKYTGFYAGSAGLNSTAEDLTKFGMELLNWTVNPGAAKLGLSWKQQIYPQARFYGSVLGKGFILFNTQSSDFDSHQEGYQCYGHTGTDYGSRAIIYACPELDWGFVAVFNVRNVNREHFLRSVSQKLIDLNILRPEKQELSFEAQKWVDAVKEFQQQEPPMLVKPVIADPNEAPEGLKEYLGVYHSGIQGKIKVEISTDNKLVFLGGTLSPHPNGHADKFVFQKETYFGHSGETFTFVRDASRKVVRINAFQNLLIAEKVSSL